MLALHDGWELAPSPAGGFAHPAETHALSWLPARVPGTAAGATGDPDRDYDREDWWFRCRFALPADWAGRPLVMALDGLATVAEVYLDGQLVHASDSMWARHEVAIGALTDAEHELAIVCRALAPLLARRRRPAARWRTRVVNEGNLRWFRTMMFGRSPGFAPSPAPVGPWRAVGVTPADVPRCARLGVRTRLENGDGVVSVTVRPGGGARGGTVTVAGHSEALTSADGGELAAQLRVPGAAAWWPHTHGTPVLHELRVALHGAPAPEVRRVGFRALDWAADIPRDGLALQVNGTPLFIRGAVWTPADLMSMAPSAERLRSLLGRVRDAGMNMLRVVGTGAYESEPFHDLCDELGILVWQDLMFANLDYPVSDPAFRDAVEREARQVLGELAGRPSLAVLCGNSEVEQQPAMTGLDPALGRDELWDRRLAEIVTEEQAGCAYVRSTPCGGDLPFHADRGVTHYFGVSGYFAAPAAARRAGVRFASECLAFANVPDEVDVPVHHPRWKQGVPRDAGTGWGLGAGWDFDDVRDHYLQLLYGVDAVALRRFDHERYLELSRLASGEVMAEVMGDWRRAGSGCSGALVLWCKDMLRGAGLGVLDHAGRPKVAYHYLRRALAPRCVWTTDEGVNGVAIHVANDREGPLRARLRTALYRDLESPVGEAVEDLELVGRETVTRSVEGMLGRFVDAAWAYRFGPATADAIVVTLESAHAPERPLSQAFRFPAGYPTVRAGAAELGLSAVVGGAHDDGGVALTLGARRAVYGVRIRAAGFEPEDDAFSLEPGRERTVALRAEDPDARFGGAAITAANLAGQLTAGGGAR